MSRPEKKKKRFFSRKTGESHSGKRYPVSFFESHLVFFQLHGIFIDKEMKFRKRGSYAFYQIMLDCLFGSYTDVV